MHLVAFISALVALIGLILILMTPTPPWDSSNKKLIGVIMFACGLLVFLYMISSHTMDIKIG